jgi:3-phosphoshikimate 1-carboxyvinyltransferase
MIDYPPTLEIQPLTRPPHASIRVPGSKSITNRALVLAALSQSGCTLHGALRSEDTEVMVEALRTLGFGVETDWETETIRVNRPPGDRIIPAREANLFVGNSGTSMRFLAAMVSLGWGHYRLDGVPRMRERPIEDLLVALRQIGVDSRSEAGNGCPPVIIETVGLKGGHVRIRGDISSQFLSGLLMAVPLAKSDTTIVVEGTLVSRPYVDMTIAMMREFGAEIDRTIRLAAVCGWRIPGNQVYYRPPYEIEPDASAASYFFAAAAIAQGEIAVRLPCGSLQGDSSFVDVLKKMGCTVVTEEIDGTMHVQGSTSKGASPLRGIDVDMNAISDTVMTLAAVALFAEGPTTIRNVAHIRHKETDRIAALATELRKLGAGVEEFPDGLRITPGPLHGAEIDTYNDHRMAMSMALVGLKVPGVVIRNPGCVAKTYPNFFRDLEKLR